MAIPRQRTIRTRSIPQSFEQVLLLRRHSLNAFYTPTCDFAGLCTYALNMLGLRFAHTLG